MRSLQDAGLDNTPFCRVADLAGHPLAFTNAVYRDGQYGPEVVFSARLLADAFDLNGNAIPARVRFSLASNDQRLQAVAAFESDKSEIGPLVMVQLAPQEPGQSGAWVWQDASDLMEALVTRGDALPLAAPTPSNGRVVARTGTGSARRRKQDDDTLEALPF